MADVMKIALQNICKHYQSTLVIENLSLVIDQNELFFILGPSGCGKTTLLRILAGFIAPDSGEILFNDKSVSHLPPEKRCLPMVFQSYALWPHLSVFENVAYGLRLQPLKEHEIRRRAFEALEITRMNAFKDRSPNQLSGGQQQRVAISRALAVNPNALLFDEPLSNLDARLRIEMREELLEIHRRRPFTAIYVTHDQEEAMTMASRIAVLEKGKLLQVGTPREIYTKPKNQFVAEFMGAMNWLPARVKEVQKNQRLLLETPVGVLNAIMPAGIAGEGQELLAGFRPTVTGLDGSDSVSASRILCEVIQTQYAGASQRLVVKPCRISGNHSELTFHITEVNPRQTRKNGDRLEITLATEDVMVISR